MKSYVFDTSAILTLFDNEEGADTVAELLHLAIHERIKIFVSAISMVKFRYQLIRQNHEHIFVDKKMDELYDMPITVVDFNQVFIEQSAIYKSTTKMSFADACIAGTAKCLVQFWYTKTLNIRRLLTTSSNWYCLLSQKQAKS